MSAAPFHAGEIALPAGVELLTEAGATVCVCAAPKVETETAAAEAGAAEPELIRKPKAGDEAEAK